MRLGIVEQAREPTMLPDQTRDLLDLLLRQVIGTKTEIVETEMLNRAQDYWVLRLSLRHPTTDILVKLAGADATRAAAFDRTAALRALIVSQTAIPMPPILAVDVSYRIWPWRYLIQALVPGKEWAEVRPQLDGSELSGAYHQIGEVVAALHSVSFPTFGELDGHLGIRGTSDFFTALRERAFRSIRNPALLARYLTLLNDRADLFTGVTRPCLCHEDLHHYNLLFDRIGARWQLAAVLDFDKAWAGTNEIDLARMELWINMIGPGFWDAYFAQHRLDPLYGQRRPIYQLLWCLEYAMPSVKHKADTQELCAVLGIPPIDDFG